MSFQRFPRSIRAVVSTAALMFVTLSCGRRAAIPAPSRQTPVILISIDTLRSDHLPAYGYKSVETPAIDALRADSILYRRAYSHTPLTFPSHVSILTGMLPADNGVRDNVGYRVSPSAQMVQEVLKKNGYVTGGAISAFVLRHETLLSRGFDFFDDAVQPVNGQIAIGRVQRTGGETLAAGKPWIDAHINKPFFFFLHLYDPHTPYTPPEPYFSRYTNHYDGEIAYSDSLVGELIADLKQKGVYDKALIILLSDHGEGLNEHGEEEHGFFLYREAIQVPLLVKLPNSARGGTSVDAPVQLVDVFPTIVERTASAMPPGNHPGQSLLAFLDKNAPSRQIYSETYYGRFHFGWSELHSLISGNDHYIRAPQPELYDLDKDPGEKHNAIEENRRAYVRLRAAIEPLIKEPEAPSNVDSETKAKLAALGYIGSTVQTAKGQALPDPKTKMGEFHDVRLAYTYFENNNPQEALNITQRLLKNNPELVDMWDLQAKILFKLNRRQDALETAKEGLRHSPMAITLLFNVADIALALNDLDTAQKHLEIAEKIEPGQAHETLARVWLLRGNQQKGEEEAKLALQTHQIPTKALMILGSIEMDRQHYEKALEYYRQAGAGEKRWTGKPVENLHANSGDALARLGRNDEAEREFRAELVDFPKNARAYSSLIVLLVTERRTDEATRLVFDAIKANPTPNMYEVISETLKAIGDDRGAMFWAYQGIQKFPQDAELRRLPQRLERVTPLLREHMRTN